MTSWTCCSLRFCGNEEAVQHALEEFKRSYEEGTSTSTSSYMSPDGLFATKWTSGRRPTKASVWNPLFDRVQKREAPIRLPEVFCALCGLAGSAVKLKRCSRCKRQWYCRKEHQMEAWRSGHRDFCTSFEELDLKAYDSECVIICWSKWSAPWSEVELRQLSPHFPEVLFQLRHAEQSIGNVGSIEASQGISTSYSRKTCISDIKKAAPHGLSSAIKIEYAGPYADLLPKSGYESVSKLWHT